MKKLLASLLLIVLTSGCNQTDLNTWAEAVVTSLEAAAPIFQTETPQAYPTIEKALAVARELKTALANHAGNAVDILLQLTAPDGLFNKLLDDAGAITNPETRRTVMVSLLLANVALRGIAAGLQKSEQPVKELRAASGIASIEKALKELRF